MKKYTRDELMKSLDGIKKAEAPPFLRTRVFAALNHEPEKPISSLVPVMAMLLLIVILISNIFLYTKAQSISTDQSNTPQQFYQTYSLPSTPSIYAQDINQ